MNKDDIHDEFNMVYDEWVQRLWNNLDTNCKVEGLDNATERQLRKMQSSTFFVGFGEFESTIRRLIIPNNEHSISHLVLKNAWDGEKYDADGTLRTSAMKDALQRDSYYATMVRGSCIKIPLTPDIWCPHDELQHTGEETQHFFRVMWEESIFFFADILSEDVCSIRMSFAAHVLMTCRTFISYTQYAIYTKPLFFNK